MMEGLLSQLFTGMSNAQQALVYFLIKSQSDVSSAIRILDEPRVERSKIIRSCSISHAPKGLAGITIAPRPYDPAWINRQSKLYDIHRNSFISVLNLYPLLDARSLKEIFIIRLKVQARRQHNGGLPSRDPTRSTNRSLIQVRLVWPHALLVTEWFQGSWLWQSRRP